MDIANHLVGLTRTDLFSPIIAEQVEHKFVAKWKGSALLRESTLHQVSPYIGKIKSSMAGALIAAFTREGETVYDPFCGSGTVALESWAAKRKVVASDLSPYAVALTRAKLFPCSSTEEAISEIDKASLQVHKVISAIDLREVPLWVRAFYHPETLREAIAWSRILRERKSYFLLSCLLGILHHQRPGFLSYPSSHTVPYLREKKFPRHLYSELYEYRSVQDRLKKKVERALKRLPQLDYNIERKCYMRNAATFVPERKIAAIVTSPPYMRQLDYGRDNRLRLWFIGESDWKTLDHSISPDERRFIAIIKRCLNHWKDILIPAGMCILVLGDTYSRQYGMSLPDLIVQIATQEIGGYSLIWRYTEQIPNDRRVRRGCKGSQTETVLILNRTKVN